MSIIPALTSIIGVVARGRTAKATAGAILPAIVGALSGPDILAQFQGGVAESLSPVAYSAGVALGALAAGGVNWCVAWIAPKNAD